MGRARVNKTPNDGRASPSKRVMRIFNDNFRSVCVGGMSWARRA